MDDVDGKSQDPPSSPPPRGILLSQGAEARVYLTSFCGRTAIIKERFKKRYRHPVLDSKITQRRLTGEARSMVKARKLGVPVPTLYSVDELASTITAEYITGLSVKDYLLDLPSLQCSAEKLQGVADLIGKAVAKLHDGGLVHGDLTTSNMLLHDGHSMLVLIDFGLAFNSTLPEDKAVDLYVLERALLSLHSAHQGLMEAVLEAYCRASRNWSAVHNKLAQVRLRGRKRVMVG